MNFYQQQVLFIKENVLPKEYLCEQVIRSKKFIDANFSDALELKDMAGQAYFSKFHFLRLFKQLYGRTPHQYLTEIRIEKAKQLLRAANPVSEVCISVGFKSTSSFKALFKLYTGFTPALYQKRLKHTLQH